MVARATAKFEINKEAVLNPIIQDVKKGKLRCVPTCAPTVRVRVC